MGLELSHRRPSTLQRPITNPGHHLCSDPPAVDTRVPQPPIWDGLMCQSLTQTQKYFTYLRGYNSEIARGKTCVGRGMETRHRASVPSPATPLSGTPLQAHQSESSPSWSFGGFYEYILTGIWLIRSLAICHGSNFQLLSPPWRLEVGVEGLKVPTFSTFLGWLHKK